MTQIEPKPSTDSVVEEVLRVKETLAHAKGFDIRRILDDARQKQDEGDRTVLPPPANEK